MPRDKANRKQGAMKVNKPMSKSNPVSLAALLLLGVHAQVTLAQKPYAYKPADLNQVRNQGGEAQIMPATFLREYDPVTVMFNKDRGPAGGGPLDKPEPFVTLKPSQPGEYRWLDPRTLEFRPSLPWKPMQVYTLKALGETRTLTALLSPPQSISPASGSSGLAPFARVELEFSQSVAPEILARFVTFEASPLPGIETKNARIYGSSDYRIKVSEKSGKGSFLYGFVFKKPFANGQRIRTIVRLAADPSLSDAKRVYYADTRKEFAVEKAGTYEYQFTLNSAGSVYGRDQAIRLPQDGTLIFDFSAKPASLSLSQVKSLLNFSPAPRRLDWSLSENRLTARISVDQERIYNVVLAPVDIRDADGRKLQLDKPCSFFVYQPLEKQYARWGLGHGLVERFGPQHFPLLVSGIKSLDIRVYKIDPLHKAFWPYPESPVRIDEANLPPGPGEEPPPEKDLLSPLSTYDMGRHIRMLGSPPYSAVIDLDREGISRFQSLDLKPIFAKISGADRPGSYLVGFRPLDGSSERSYIRIQATDLSLSSVESKREALFTVTSLASGRPVADAEIAIEGLSDNNFTNLAKGKTDKDGMLIIPQTDENYVRFKDASVKRVVVRKEDDMLVLDSRMSEAPPEFANNHWYSERSSWLGWLASQPYDYSQDKVSAGFAFTERPIYRPGEKVYFKIIVRTLYHGAIQGANPEGSYTAHIRSPAGLTYDFPVKLNANHAFHDSLTEKDLPTGDYELEVVHSHPKTGPSTIARTSFKIDAYKIPKFDVKLNGPDKTPNDRPVSIKLNASYYAGGKVAGQNVAWKVVSYPYSYVPEGVTGFILSTDSRYGAVVEERQEGATETKDVTDDNGQSILVVNPQSATAGNPRRYICEATVTDVDEQTVSNRLSFQSLPPFVLGLKVERHITGSSTIKTEVVTLGIDGKFAAGHKVSVALKKMSWISYLQETDFSLGKPKYRTQESMELISEKSVTTAATPVTLEFPNRDPGVYVVEVDSRDRLGRLQSVKADLFLAGDKPVSWKKGDQLLFETVPDKEHYLPGQEARILLKSPYQRGLALAIIERPAGAPEYRWVEIADGQGTLTLAVTPEMAPKIPVSFLLMRPRISDEKRIADGSTMDAGRPQSVANTTWLKVDQAENALKVSLEHPAQVRPGTPISVTIGLKDSHGGPRSGEVALWLVDEAVLSLAKEKPLDPLPSFTAEVGSHISIRDARNMIMGDLRVPESPGGDGGEGLDGIFGKMTVRKNFRSVPYWNPSIQVDKSGKAVVTFPMSDDLTNFAVRAVATSGTDRFGVGASQVRVRLPVLVQPALPRFVRLGDRFRAGGVARIVEGTGGPGAYSIEAQGLKITNASGPNAITLEANKPLSLKSELTVQEPGFDANGNLRYDSVTVKMAVVRNSDQASDAFSVSLPLRFDRPFAEENLFTEVKAEKPLTLAALPEAARPGTVARQLVLSDQMGILKALSAMTSLVQYPFGCSEQQISRSLPAVLYRDIWAKYGLPAPMADIKKHVATTMDYLNHAQGPDGLIGYWPASTGYVYLTAYAVEFMTEVKHANETAKAGYAFDETMYRKAIDALNRGLRSDYAHFVSGEAYYERSAALLALAKAGALDVGYARELAAQTNDVDVQSQAKVYEALQKNGTALKSEMASLHDRLWSQTVFKQESGREVFAGLQQRSFRIGDRVHQNEITALAGMISAFSAAPANGPPGEVKRPEKLPLLVNELVTLGDRKDWGSTQANSLSLLALRDYLAAPSGNNQVTGTLSLGGTVGKIEYDSRKGALARSWADPAQAELRLDRNGKSPIYARYSLRYLPLEPGSQAPAAQKGFVVKRELIFIDAAKGNRRVSLDRAGTSHVLHAGDILEEHIQVENPRNRAFVAVSAPFAAGLEYMNPRLETSGEDAKPSGATTNSGDYQAFKDDEADYFFEAMPAGTYDFYFRLRASVEGEFSHPSARAEMMYEMGTYGTSPGAKIVVQAAR